MAGLGRAAAVSRGGGGGERRQGLGEDGRHGIGERMRLWLARVFTSSIF
jgi:hypothetical protein